MFILREDNYFFLQEDQACATCLILACSTAACDREVSAWATRAFFRYVCPFSLVFGHFFLMDALANVVITSKHLSDHIGKLVKFICKKTKSGTP